MRPPGASARKGSVYVALLGVSMIVTVIGLSALTAVRIQRRSAEAGNDAIEARLYARSAADLALFWINNDPQWRQRYLSDVWTPDGVIGRGTFSVKLVDEQDGNLADDFGQPARLYTRGSVGDAVRIYSLLLDPPETGMTANLLVNAGMETGTAQWAGIWSTCKVTLNKDDAYAGTACLAVTLRTTSWAGPAQDITGKITSGMPYATEAWVKAGTGTCTFRICLYIQSSLGSQAWIAAQSAAPIGTTWTRLAGTVTPTWIGELQQATWYVNTVTSTTDFKIDDVRFTKYETDQPAGLHKMSPVPGSWQRVTLP